MLLKMRGGNTMGIDTGIFLNREMRKIYDDLHPPDSRVAKKARRWLDIDGPVKFEVFLSGMQREEYEARNREYEATGQKDCRLCWSKESLVYRNQMAITADGIPFFPSHMLLRTVRPERIDSTFEVIMPNVKRGVVEKKHLDCRPEFSREDIVTMGYLMKDAQDYIINQSMGGSGASIGEHIHAHAFLKTQTDFPLLNPVCFTRLEGVQDVWVNRLITYGLLIRGEPEKIAAVFAALRNEFGFPSNHYLKVDDAFGGLIGLYVPRVELIPPLSRFASVNWKFGAFEVLGLYDANTPEDYHTLTGDEVCAATKSVTLQDSHLQAAMEQTCRAVLTGKNVYGEDRWEEEVGCLAGADRFAWTQPFWVVDK